MSSSAFIILSCLVATVLAFASSHPMENQYLDANYYEEPYQVYYGKIMDQQDLLRERRSPHPDTIYDNGIVRGDINRDDNGNTKIGVSAGANIYKDKARSVDAEAQWSKVMSGPGRAKPQFGGRITYRW